MEVFYVRRNQVARVKEFAGLDGHFYPYEGYRGVALCDRLHNPKLLDIRWAVGVHHDCRTQDGETRRGLCTGEPAIISSGEWPCPNHRDYAACVYAALLELDGVISKKLWEQINLPFTAE